MKYNLLTFSLKHFVLYDFPLFFCGEHPAGTSAERKAHCLFASICSLNGKYHVHTEQKSEQGVKTSRCEGTSRAGSPLYCMMQLQKAL